MLIAFRSRRLSEKTSSVFFNVQRVNRGVWYVCTLRRHLKEIWMEHVDSSNLFIHQLLQVTIYNVITGTRLPRLPRDSNVRVLTYRQIYTDPS